MKNSVNIDFSTLMRVLNNDNDLGGRFLTGFLAGEVMAVLLAIQILKYGKVYENICS